MDTDFTCYLPPPATPGAWGIDLWAGGRATIPAQRAYPPSGHPIGFDFAWDRGRTLRQYAVVALTHGQGVLVDHNRRSHPIVSGQAFLIRPGRWHTYRPDAAHGWRELFLVFDGPAPRRLLDAAEDAPPIIQPDTELFAAITAALNLLQHQPGGFLSEAEACLARALARLLSHGSCEDHQLHAPAMRRAAMRLQQGSASIAALAREADLSSAQFRRCFRSVVGHCPRDYAVLVRLERAKSLLSVPEVTILAVAERSGFSSASFFSRLFTRHCGCSPQEWRRRVVGAPPAAGNAGASPRATRARGTPTAGDSRG